VASATVESGVRAAWYRRLAWLLLGLALLRGLQVLASDPLLAIANNYDTIRVQSCIEAWPVRDASIHPTTRSPAAPFERYRFTDIGGTCFMTSEALFAWLAWPGMWLEQSLTEDRSFSIRWKGSLQFGLWLALAIGCTRRLLALDRSDLAAGHAAVAAVAFVDPGNLLYFNTFYTESSAVLFLYALLAGCVVTMAQNGRARPWRDLAIGLAAMLLALAKIQHLFVPLVTVLCVALVAWLCRLDRRRLLLVVTLGALLGSSAQWLHMNSAGNDSIRSANLVDTLFTALLPNASQPEAMLSELGLPATCIEQSGSSWYSPGMSDRKLCPEVFALRQPGLIAAAVRDPLMLGRALVGGAKRADAWIPAGLGVVEGQDSMGLPASIPSWSRVHAKAGPLVRCALICVLPVLALVLVCARRSSTQAPANAVLLVLCVLPLVVLTTAILGDGYVDVPKHFQLGFASLTAAVVVLACLALDRVLRGIESRRAMS
jgi:hypothetical protein